MATEPTEPNQQDWISEEDIATQLGIPREKIRAARPHLGPGEVSQMGKAVCWMRATAVAFARRIGLTAAIPEAAPAPALSEKNPPPAEGEELTVFSCPGPGGLHFPQQHLIKAKRANGDVVVVRVLDSRKYLPKDGKGNPMKLRAKKAASGTWWILIGREPRFPGMW